MRRRTRGESGEGGLDAARSLDSESSLDPEEKAAFTAERDLRDGEMTDQQILIAIRTGQFQNSGDRTL